MELFNTQVAVENLGPLLAGLLITIELTFVSTWVPAPCPIA